MKTAEKQRRIKEIVRRYEKTLRIPMDTINAGPRMVDAYIAQLVISLACNLADDSRTLAADYADIYRGALDAIGVWK
jgi:hypothetical protein